MTIKNKERLINICQFIVLQEYTITNSKHILEFLEKMLGTPSEKKLVSNWIFMSPICIAIYSHAVEEYGKLPYLKSLKPNELGMVTIQYQEKFKDHKTKFNLAQKHLPKFTSLQHLFNDTQFEIDWNSRLNVFNTDIDN